MQDIIKKRVTQYLQRRIIGNVNIKITRFDTFICTIDSDTDLHFTCKIYDISEKVLYGLTLDEIQNTVLREYRKFVESVHFF